MKNIRLQSDSIILRSMTADDLSSKVKWYNDPEIRQTLILDEDLQLDKTVAWFNTVSDSQTRLDLMIESPDGRPIGIIGLVEINRKNATAEIFIVIGEKDYWGKGIMLKAESLLIDWAFNEFGLSKIWAHARAANIASIITMKKLGFQIEGTLRRHVVLSGQREDVLLVGLLKDEFRCSG